MQTTVEGRYRFTLRDDDVIVVATQHGSPVDVVSPDCWDRDGNPTLPTFASRWVEMHG